ncbi:hypothetical protein A3219_13215 [Salmonella enterica]|nr:hypothetical protein A3219_13215 [Salmonella enterica]
MRLFSIWATETQWTGACSASFATLVPGLSVEGEDTNAFAEWFSVNNKQTALSARVIFFMLFP